MSKELLEKAFEKTKEEEAKTMKRQKIARAIGVAAGLTATLALDALVLWAILKFMLSVGVSYLAVLGSMILFQLLLSKIKSYL